MCVARVRACFYSPGRRAIVTKRGPPWLLTGRRTSQWSSFEPRVDATSAGVTCAVILVAAVPRRTRVRMRPVFFLPFCGQIVVPPSCKLTCMRPLGAARQSSVSIGPFKVTVHFLHRVVQVFGWLPRVVKG